jgi:hypothetical protein
MNQNISYSRGRNRHVRQQILALLLSIVVALAMVPMLSTITAYAEELQANGTPVLTPTADGTALQVDWEEATEGTGPYKYQFYYSTYNNVENIYNAEANGSTAYPDNKRPSNANSPGYIMSLTENTKYYVTVVAIDAGGAKVAYPTVFATTGQFKFDVYETFSDVGPIKIKTYSLAELTALVPQNAKALGFIQSGSPWTIYGTKTYVKIQDLLSDAKVNFAAGDKVKPVAPDNFGNDVTFETIAAEKYFYPAASAPGTTGGAIDGRFEVGTVLALKWNSLPIDGTAGATLTTAANGEYYGIRWFIGLSDANYNTATAAGNRFPTGPNKLIITHTYSVAEKIQDIQQQIDEKTKEGDQKDTDKAQLVKDKEQLNKEKAALQTKLDTANRTIFKANVPTKSKFKLTAGAKKATVSWKKISTANKGYQVQLATNKKFTKGKKLVKVAKTATIKTTIGSLKKGTTYYVKVRGVAQIGTKTVYTKWSAVKTVKVK